MKEALHSDPRHGLCRGGGEPAAGGRPRRGRRVEPRLRRPQRPDDGDEPGPPALDTPSVVRGRRARRDARRGLEGRARRRLLPGGVGFATAGRSLPSPAALVRARGLRRPRGPRPVSVRPWGSPRLRRADGVPAPSPSASMPWASGRRLVHPAEGMGGAAPPSAGHEPPDDRSRSSAPSASASGSRRRRSRSCSRCPWRWSPGAWARARRAIAALMDADAADGVTVLRGRRRRKSRCPGAGARRRAVSSCRPGREYRRSTARSSAARGDVNQAPITGESMPVARARATRSSPARSTVTARSRSRVTQAGAATRRSARIVRMVEEAQRPARPVGAVGRAVSPASTRPPS